MEHKYCCVIDARGFYKTFVRVHLEVGYVGGITEKVLLYTLGEGEALLDTPAPTSRLYAGTQGFVKPRWNDTAWIEGATQEEIAQWEREHPAPPTPQKSELAILQETVDMLVLSGLGV